MQEFNTTVRQFPTNLTAMIFKMNVKPNFTVADEGAISAPPKVDFGKPAAPVAPAPGTTAPPARARRLRRRAHPLRRRPRRPRRRSPDPARGATPRPLAGAAGAANTLRRVAVTAD